MEKSNEKQGYFEVAEAVWGMKIIFVNIYMIKTNESWVLVDTGLPGSADRILKMAHDLFGEQQPAAIILTHAHFDHRGAIDVLLDHWQVPVYVHPMELPYLTGKSSYPPPDSQVGGGLMSLLSVLYPKRPIDLGQHVHALDETGSVPFLPDWLYIYTPGHSPGHISLFRNRDRVLIAGDAFVTTKQESAISTLTQSPHVSGPPKYFTPDWIAAKQSVIKLREYHPAIAATGHGKPMHGEELTEGLNTLINNFEKEAVPKYGRYVSEPAQTNKRGVQYIPPVKINPIIAISALAIAGLTALGIYKGVKNQA